IPPYERKAASRGDPEQLPEGLVAVFGDRRFKHHDLVTAVAVSPDGESLAAGGHDNALPGWGVDSGFELLSLAPFPAAVLSVAWAGDLLACGLSNGTVRVYQGDTGKLVTSFPVQAKKGCCTLAFDPDGTRLATGGDQAAHVWDPRTGQLLLTLDTENRRVLSVAFGRGSALGKQAALVTGSENGKERLWDGASSQPGNGTDPLQTLTRH